MQQTLIAFVERASHESIANKTLFGVRRNAAAYSYSRLACYLPGGSCADLWQAAEIQIVVNGKMLSIVKGIHLISLHTQAHLVGEGFITEQGIAQLPLPLSEPQTAVEDDPWLASMSEAERGIIRKWIELQHKLLRG